MNISLPSKIVLSPDVLFQELEGESVLLNLANEQYYGLNQVGTDIWEVLVEEKGDVETAIKRLLAVYDVTEDTLRQDMDALFTQWKKAEIVSI